MRKQSLLVMGTSWTLETCEPGEDVLLEDCNGYADWTERRIRVLNPKPDKNSLKNMDVFRKKVTRHEIVHAFLFESGLMECSGACDSWAMNEEMVDWFARNGEKIYQAWKEADAL